MFFYDCRMSYGKHINDLGPFKPCGTIDELIREMANSGFSGGLVYNVAADISGVVSGNACLAADLTSVSEKYQDVRLWGMYTLLPSCTNEIPPPDELPHIMKTNRMAALRINPAAHRYLPSPRVLGDYLEMASTRKIPVMLDTSCGIAIEAVEGVMAAFPDLTVILFYNDVWPCDRILRPFLKAYSNMHLDTTHVTADGAYEETAKQFGADRLIYGSGFPRGYMGINMLTVIHSELSEEEKQAVAGKNLLSLLGEADLS